MNSISTQTDSQPAENYLSLVIRVWWRREGDGNVDKTWHSEVEIIQSGERWRFTKAEEVENFLHGFLDVES